MIKLGKTFLVYWNDMYQLPKLKYRRDIVKSLHVVFLQGTPRGGAQGNVAF
jgi:hypothetical protein